MQLVRPVLLPNSVCFLAKSHYTFSQTLALVEQIFEHPPHRLRLGFVHLLYHCTRETISGSEEVAEVGRRLPKHREKVRGINIPVVLEMLHCLPFIDFVADVCGKILFISGDCLLKFRMVDCYHVSIYIYASSLLVEVFSCLNY